MEADKLKKKTEMNIRERFGETPPCCKGCGGWIAQEIALDLREDEKGNEYFVCGFCGTVTSWEEAKSKYTDEQRREVIAKALETPEGCKKLVDAMSVNDERDIRRENERRANGEDIGKMWLYRG